MPFYSQYFNVNDQFISWGTTLEKAMEKLSGTQQLPSFGGRPNVRYKCAVALGLPANEASLYAPFPDRPVMSVSFQLQAPPLQAGEKAYVFFRRYLEQLLGPPQKFTENFNPPGYTPEGLSNAVVYNARWTDGEVEVEVSIYGGWRNESSGVAAAGLYFTWRNEHKAACVFRERNAIIEKQLAESLSTLKTPLKFHCEYKQRPFFIPDYSRNEFDLALKRPEMRADQLALYRKELLQTPMEIAAQLNEQEIFVAENPSLKKWIVCNKWDAVLLDPDEKNTIIFTDMQPARGSGNYTVDVKELHICDSRNSAALPALIKTLESIDGVSIGRQVGYDD